MRGQLAGQSFCIRRLLPLILSIGTQDYTFFDFNILGSPEIGGLLSVRSMTYRVASGAKMIYPRSWEWFDLYHRNNPVPASGPPNVWAQYLQGSSGGNPIVNYGSGTVSSGSLSIYPIPDFTYTVIADSQCYPIALTKDNDPEAIPYEWTDAVPFGAAWMALLSAQTSARMAEAEKYFEYFQQYVQRARSASTPDVLPYQYEQVPDPTSLNQMGLPQGRGGGQ
jgi:hypothetical protein